MAHVSPRLELWTLTMWIIKAKNTQKNTKPKKQAMLEYEDFKILKTLNSQSKDLAETKNNEKRKNLFDSNP